MISPRILLFAGSAFALASCSMFKGGGGGNDYDTPGADTSGGGGGSYDTSNPYGVPGASSGESAPYQPVNPPAGGNPTYGQAAYEDSGTTPAPSPAPTPAPAPTPPRHSAPAAGAGSGSRTHTVVKGDTLWGISRKYGVSVDAIKKANNMTKDTAVLGSKLIIPAR